MDSKHLTKGSTKPLKPDGKLVLYSMVVCPFAIRVRLVLLVKQIPHEIVNIHLQNKPDWYFEVNPKGTIPSLDTGSQILTESLDICDYLDEKYPEPQLYPSDKAKRMRDKALMAQFNELSDLYFKSTSPDLGETLMPHLEAMKPHVQRYEDELKSRGTVFFGGAKPSMIDYMLWPWAARCFVLKLQYNQELPGEDEYPCLYAWCAAMRKLREVIEANTNVKQLYNINKQYAAGTNPIHYDGVE